MQLQTQVYITYKFIHEKGAEKLVKDGYMQLTTQLTQQFQIFEFSTEDISSDYRFLLRLVNTFTIDTDEHYPVCYKVNDAKAFKNAVYYFMLANHHVYYRLARLTGTFKIIAIDFQCCIFSGIIRRISNYMCWVLFICKRSTSFIESINQSGSSSKKNIC